MRGTNPVREIRADAEKMELQDVFYTIQGEGPFVGIPAVFVRVAGCNLRCHFCDTDFESRYPDNEVQVEQIAKRVLELTDKAPLCVVTGGEPFRQPKALAALITQLCVRGGHVQIETAGTLWHPYLDNILPRLQCNMDYPRAGRWSIVCSPKTPLINPKVVENALAWKYILHHDDVSPRDGLPMKSTQLLGVIAPVWRTPDPTRVFIQPMDMPDPEEAWRNLNAAIDVCKKYGYRLSLQTHKMIGLP